MLSVASCHHGSLLAADHAGLPTPRFTREDGVAPRSLLSSDGSSRTFCPCCGFLPGLYDLVHDSILSVLTETGKRISGGWAGTHDCPTRVVLSRDIDV